ncbi:hypothetical protein N8T08_003893, partial [Aspergillus melleus]
PIPNQRPSTTTAAHALYVQQSIAFYAAAPSMISTSTVFPTILPGWDNNELVISRVNGGVCWAVYRSGEMCGRCFDSWDALFHHMHIFHRMQIRRPTQETIDLLERFRGREAFIRFIRSQGWRRAQFAHEPGRGPIAGIINELCNEMEHLAYVSDLYFGLGLNLL